LYDFQFVVFQIPQHRHGWLFVDQCIAMQAKQLDWHIGGTLINKNIDYPKHVLNISGVISIGQQGFLQF
jgi:hypothetical protein